VFWFKKFIFHYFVFVHSQTNFLSFTWFFEMLAGNGLGLAEGGVLEALTLGKYTNVYRNSKCLVKHRSPAFGKPLL